MGHVIPKYRFRTLSASEDDYVDAVVALVNLCYRGEGSWTTERGIVSGQRITRDALVRDLTDGDCDVLIAVACSAERPCSAAESLLGCVRTGVATSTVVGPLSGRRASYLGMLAVKPELQSKGLGRALMDAVELQALRYHRSERVVMDVLDSRPELLAWYERRGFTRAGESTPARPFIESKGEELLVDCSFILLEKDI